MHELRKKILKLNLQEEVCKPMLLDKKPQENDKNFIEGLCNIGQQQHNNNCGRGRGH